MTIGRGEEVSEAGTIHNFSAVVPMDVVSVIEDSSIWISFRPDAGLSGIGFEVEITRIPDRGEYTHRQNNR